MTIASSPTSPIRVASQTVRAMLSQDVVLVMPWSQRGFAWSPTNIVQLIDDLSEVTKEQRGYYSLGQICYAYGEAPGQHELVDGNQRMTSILIILSIYRDLCSDPVRRDEINRLMWMGDGAPADKPVLRLRVQKEARDFLEDKVLTPGATDIAVEPGTPLVETQRNILDCRDAAREKLLNLSERDRDTVVGCLLDACWLISVGVETSDEAWVLIQTQEDRGVHHHPSDLLKFRLIDEMPIDDQAPAAAAWDHWQSRLGSDTMLQLLSTIRTLEEGKRQAKPLDVDIVKRFNLKEKGLDFVQNRLVPRAEALDKLRRLDIDAGPATRDTKRSLMTLNWLTHPYWTIPAIRWLETRGEKHPQTASFFWHLDRLGWMIRISSADAGHNEQCLKEVLNELNQTAKSARPPETLASLRILPDLKKSVLVTLNGRTFEQKHVCPLILRRLSFEYARTLQPDTADAQLDLGFVNDKTTTTEHILPRSDPAPGTVWAANFKDRAGMRDNAFRLGNLAFLTSDENQKASASDFADKREVYAGSMHWLAKEALEWPEWTSDVISQRTQKLIRLLFDVWKL